LADIVTRFTENGWSGTQIAKVSPNKVAQKTTQTFLSVYGVMEHGGPS